jgi:hypothetical protein
VLVPGTETTLPAVHVEKGVQLAAPAALAKPTPAPQGVQAAAPAAEAVPATHALTLPPSGHE